MNMTKKGVLAVILFLSGTVALAGFEWTTKRLTNKNIDKWDPRIAVSGSDVYVIWTECPPSVLNTPLYFLGSPDGGVTWQTAKRLTDSDVYAWDPAVAAYGVNVYIVWQQNDDVYFRKSTDRGATWQTAKKITTGGIYPEYLDIAVSGTNIYVVWQQEFGDDEYALDDIFIKRSTDGGATWKSTVRLANNYHHNRYPAVAASGSYVYVAWEKEEGDGEIYVRRSANDGANWTAAVNISNTPAAPSLSPDIAALGAKVYVVWDENKYYQGIYFGRSLNYGATWPTATRITGDAETPSGPAIGAKNANVGVAYYYLVGSDTEVYLKNSAHYGGGWNRTAMTSNTGSSGYPDVAYGPSTVYVVWVDDTPGRDEIYLKYSPLI